MKLYRYFHLTNDIFANITGLNFDTVSEYEEYIREKEFPCKNTHTSEYIKRRLYTEEQSRKKFIEKGGKPRLKHPYYFTFGKCDEWFYGRKNYFGSVEFLIDEFDADSISFTYGDSVPTFMSEFQDGKEYRSQVYTLNEIQELIDKYGMPNQWNTFEKFGPENYIEVQVWTNEFKSHITSQRTQFNDMSVSELSTRIIKSNINFPQDTFNQRSASSFLGKCQDNVNWPWFCSLITRTTNDTFCADYVHGIPHAYKCALMSFVLAMELELNTKDFKTLVYSAFFHDVGRKYNENGKKHGLLSSEKIDILIDPNDDVHLWNIKDALAKHDDSPLPSDEDNLFLIWIRDIDSLDYLRLGIPQFNAKYLKTDIARSMIRFSLELNIFVFLDVQFIPRLIRG